MHTSNIYLNLSDRIKTAVVYQSQSSDIFWTKILPSKRSHFIWQYFWPYTIILTSSQLKIARLLQQLYGQSIFQFQAFPECCKPKYRLSNFNFQCLKKPHLLAKMPHFIENAASRIIIKNKEKPSNKGVALFVPCLGLDTYNCPGIT